MFRYSQVELVVSKIDSNLNLESEAFVSTFWLLALN